MPAKHNTAPPLRRYGFIGAAATVLVLLVSWVAVRAVGPAQPADQTPLMVQPTVPLTGAEPPLIPWGQASATPSTAATPPTATTGASPGAAAGPAPGKAAPKPAGKATTKPAPRQTTTPPPAPAAAFTGRYVPGMTWDRGFIGSVEVTNQTGPARTWTVKLTYDSSAGVRLGNTWNAQVIRQGDTFVFTGGPLTPGASITLGFEASKQVSGGIRPTACAVDGVPCRLG